MHSHFKLLPGVFMHKSAPQNRVLGFVGGQGDWAGNTSAASFGRIHNLLTALVNKLMVVSPYLYADFWS